MNISGIINTLKSNSGKIITSAIGIAGLGAVAYDSHNVGKIQADRYASECDANAAAYYLNNDMYLSSMSRTSENVRDFAYNVELAQGWRRVINTPIGYVKGFVSMLVSHVVPLALSLGAIFGKGAVSKGSAAGLGIYAGYKFIKNVFGFATPGSILK